MSIAVEEVKGKSIELDKRQHVPVIIWADCPVCGECQHLDLTDQYLSYPVANSEVEVHLVCEDCCEFSIFATLNLTVSNLEYGSIDKYE